MMLLSIRLFVRCTLATFKLYHISKQNIKLRSKIFKTNSRQSQIIPNKTSSTADENLICSRKNHRNEVVDKAHRRKFDRFLNDCVSIINSQQEISRKPTANSSRIKLRNAIYVTFVVESLMESFFNSADLRVHRIPSESFNANVEAHLQRSGIIKFMARSSEAFYELCKQVFHTFVC